MSPGSPEALYRLTLDIEAFFYREADLLDARDFDAWLALLADDLVYFMPIRRNVKYGDHAEQENTRQGEGISWFDEDKWTLTKRVEQIATGVHYAEEPMSRTSHMISNVRVVAARPGPEAPVEVETSCRFLVYQNRNAYESNTFIGRRHDILRRNGADWRVARREVLLDQNILMAKNLSTFF